MTIYFCSGHRNLSADEFNTHYVPQFTHLPKDSHFVIGDFGKGDVRCLKYVLEHFDKKNITIYHMFTKPRRDINKYVEKYSLQTKGGYKSDEERDGAMTYDSDKDIVWHRDKKDIPNYNPEFISGVRRNIIRRKEK